MHPVRQKHWARTWGLSIAVTAMAVAGAMIGSCAFDTKTTFCEQYGLRCKEGQQCAANEPKCIEIGGCGDGNPDKNKGEMCDDGNNIDGDGCSADCTSDETCGNEIVDELALVPEECDHGRLNGTAEDPCDFDCHFRSFICGNGTTDPDQGEQCDPGDIDSANCNSKLANMNGLMVGCKFSDCGDGYPNMVAGEQCDSAGIDTFNCNGLLCTTPACGDKTTNDAAGEQCDNGGSDTVGCNGNNNGNNGPGSCHFPSCGDGYANTSFTPSLATKPEQCDNLGGADTNTCNGNNDGNNGPGSCRFPSCGDSYANMAAGEDCDLGSNDTAQCNGNKDPSGLGNCKTPLCGDGHTNIAAGEDCDTLGGSDTSTCNGNKAGPASCRDARCGDGYPNTKANEACDRGDADTDTCNGSSAMPEIVRCQNTICGDKHVNLVAGEDCDDGTDTSRCNGSSAGPASCQPPACGDGYVNTNFRPSGASSNENCDPGDSSAGIPAVSCTDSTKTCNTKCNCI